MARKVWKPNLRFAVEDRAKRYGLLVVFQEPGKKWMIYSAKSGRHILDYDADNRRWNIGSKAADVNDAFGALLEAKKHLKDNES